MRSKKPQVSDEFVPFDKIRDRVKEAIEPLGIAFLNWEIVPGNNPGDERTCSFLFVIKPVAFLNDEDKAIKAQFDQIQKEERALEAEERLREQSRAARDDLLKISKKGIFDDVLDAEGDIDGQGSD